MGGHERLISLLALACTERNVKQTFTIYSDIVLFCLSYVIPFYSNHFLHAVEDLGEESQRSTHPVMLSSSPELHMQIHPK